MPKIRGFTLIELLVVIAIIAVVFGIIITSTNTLRKNSRDAQRQSDLRAIQAALEQYHSDQLFYPQTLSFGNSLKSPDNSKTYLSTIPTDPLTGNSAYTYGSWTNSSYSTACTNVSIATYCNWYLLCAKRENPPSGASAPNCSSGYDLQVTP